MTAQVELWQTLSSVFLPSHWFLSLCLSVQLELSELVLVVQYLPARRPLDSDNVTGFVVLAQNLLVKYRLSEVL